MLEIPMDRINKAILGWVAMCTLILGVTVGVASEKTSTRFWRIGPNDDLSILDVKVNTNCRYFVVVLYTIISTFVRTVQQEVVTPWLIQKVQNDKPKDAYVRRYAQEVAFGEVVYRWFDWFMYMHILLAQVDMMSIELIGNIVAVAYTTGMYMQIKEYESVQLID